MPEGSSLAPHEVSVPPLRRASSVRGRGRLLLGIGVVAVLTVIGVIVLRPSGAPAPVVPAKVPAALTVTAAPVGMHHMADTLLVTGTLVPWEDLSIGTEASGLTVTKVLVEEGDHVTAGQLLAKLDDSLIVAQLQQNQAQIDRAKASIGQQDAAIAQAEATERNADSDVKRARELIKSANISVQTTEQREAAASTAVAQVQSARMGRQVAQADVALAESQRAEMQARLAQTEIRAPTDGIIAKRMIRVGRVVNGADEMFRIVRDSILELDAEVPDRLLARVQPGQQARLSVLGTDGTPIIGTIRAVAPVVDPTTRNGIAHIRFPVDPRLKPGMFVSGDLMLAQADQLAVPESAVLSKDGGALVFTVSSDDHVAQRKVETGLRSDGLVAIKSGLGPDDRIVLSGAGFLTDGDLVRVVDAEKPQQ
jgi:multidrug efflux pump subunit AcrA (membrane-fusion protein)